MPPGEYGDRFVAFFEKKFVARGTVYGEQGTGGTASTDIEAAGVTGGSKTDRPGFSDIDLDGGD